MWAANSNAAGISEHGRDAYIRHKTAMP